VGREKTSECASHPASGHVTNRAAWAYEIRLKSRRAVNMLAS
jgi:hypothetical protein